VRTHPDSAADMRDDRRRPRAQPRGRGDGIWTETTGGRRPQIHSGEDKREGASPADGTTQRRSSFRGGRTHGELQRRRHNGQGATTRGSATGGTARALAGGGEGAWWRGGGGGVELRFRPSRSNRSDNVRSGFAHDDRCCEQKLEHYLIVNNGSISDEF
jgi:hypothetical protein